MHALTPDQRHEFSKEFIVTARLWRGVLGERLKAVGMTPPLWGALSALSQAPDGISQAALAARASAEPASMVRTLDLLERQGLVERRASPTDRRVNLLHLTPAARELIGEIDIVADALQLELMEGLGAAEVSAAISLFKRLRKGLDQAQDASQLKAVASARRSLNSYADDLHLPVRRRA